MAVEIGLARSPREFSRKCSCFDKCDHNMRIHSFQNSNCKLISIPFTPHKQGPYSRMQTPETSRLSHFLCHNSSQAPGINQWVFRWYVQCMPVRWPGKVSSFRNSGAWFEEWSYYSHWLLQLVIARTAYCAGRGWKQNSEQDNSFPFPMDSISIWYGRGTFLYQWRL